MASSPLRAARTPGTASRLATCLGVPIRVNSRRTLAPAGPAAALTPSETLHSRVPSRHEYCTLFDSNYLPRALALYRSLERCDDHFLLRAVCMDEESRDLLARLSLPALEIIDIAEVERYAP